MLDVEKIRKDFPILNSGVIYLDNAASSLTPEPVLQKMLEYYRQYRANVVRGVSRLSQRASDEFEKARVKVARLIDAKSDREIIMTKNATEGINLIAEGLRWRRGQKVVTTLVEHHSNFIVWLRLKQRHGIDVEVIRPNEEGLIDPSDIEKSVDDKTRLVAVTHVSNVLGVTLPVQKIAQIAHEHGAELLIDGAQSVPHLRMSVRRIKCDYLAFSGHKMLGPTGVGVLYGREELMDHIEPLCIGGGAIEDVGLDYFKLVEPPLRFEAGTPAIAEVIGLGRAVDYLMKAGMENVEAHERRLMDKMYRGLVDIPAVEVYGPQDLKHRTSIVSFNVGDLNPQDVALALDDYASIMVRSGHHCSIPLTKKLLNRPKGSVRASTYLYNTQEEIERFVSIVAEIAEALG